MMVLIAHGVPTLPEAVVSKLGLAMDLFFLISGFLVVVICDENTRPIDFFKDRLGRIVPLYWFMTLLCYFIIFSGILIPALSPTTVLGHLASGQSELLLNSLLFVPGENPFESDPNPLIPQGWTLNYEMMFYTLFALGLFLPRKWIATALTILFAAFVSAGILIEGGPAFSTWTSPLIFEFIMGLWIGVAWQHGWSLLRAFLCLLVAWAPLMLVTEMYFIEAPFAPVRMEDFPYVLGLFVFVLALDRRWSGLPDWRPASLIGDASYSIYLFHFIPIILLDRLSQTISVPSYAYLCGVLLGGILGGLACYFLIEKPMMIVVYRLRRRRASARSIEALTAA